MMASNFTSVHSIGEVIAFEYQKKDLEGEIIAVHFYKDATYYKVVVDADPEHVRVLLISTEVAKLVQKPLRERLIRKLENMTDEEVEANPNILFDSTTTVEVTTRG
jgi:hypothetical protein